MTGSGQVKKPQANVQDRERPKLGTSIESITKEIQVR